MKSEKTRRTVILLAICGIVFAGNYAQYQVSAMAYLVVARLDMSSAQYSAVLFAPYIPAALLGLVVGARADKRGAWGMVVAGCAVSIAGALLRVGADSFGRLMCASALLGVAPCAVNATALKVLGPFYGDRTDWAMGWFYAASSAGIASSLSTTALFAGENAAYLFGAALFAAFGLLWVFVAPRGAGADSCGAGDSAASSRAAFAAAGRVPAVWVVSLMLGMAMAAATAYSGYLVADYENRMDPVAAGALASFVTLGSIGGSVLGPWLRARFADYRVFIVLASVAGGLLMVAGEVLAGTPSIALMLCIGVATAVAGPAVQALPCLLPQVGTRLAGSAGGIVSTVSLGLTFAIPILLSLTFGEDYGLLMMACAAVFAGSSLLVCALPRPDGLLVPGE